MKGKGAGETEDTWNFSTLPICQSDRRGGIAP